MRLQSEPNSDMKEVTSNFVQVQFLGIPHRRKSLEIKMCNKTEIKNKQVSN